MEISFKGTSICYIREHVITMYDQTDADSVLCKFEEEMRVFYQDSLKIDIKDMIVVSSSEEKTVYMIFYTVCD